MKSWYQNRMESGVNHRGFTVPQDKFLYLTEAQAKVHNNKGTERVAKVDTAPKKEEVAVLADWDKYQKSFKANQSETTKKSETTETKGKSSLKAK